MKNFARFIIARVLAFKAHYFLKKHQVQVIAITGSVGKTSTKEAIYKILSSRFDVHSSKKSFNTDIGLSLSVLREEESGYSSMVAWLKILKNIFFKTKKPYQKIILEMGADKPGDLKKLTRIAPPHIGVITAVKPVHLAEGQFKNIDDIAREKSTLVRMLPNDGIAILNHDDPLVRTMQTPAHKFTYGVKTEAILMAKQLKSTSQNLQFMAFFKDQSELFSVPVIGEFQVYVLLPAIAVGLQMGMSLRECAQELRDFSLPPGRMNPITGIHDSHILDSSYNASPATVMTALELLLTLPADRKVAALGTMNELGEMTRQAHLDIGQKAAGIADLLIAVGPEAFTIKQGASEAGMNDEHIYTFLDSEEAGHFLKTNILPGDLILVKGSQNRVRMEKLVKLIMKDPHKAGQLLCRQSEAWEHI